MGKKKIRPVWDNGEIGAHDPSTEKGDLRFLLAKHKKEKVCAGIRKKIDQFVAEENWNSKKGGQLLQEIYKHVLTFEPEDSCDSCFQYFQRKEKSAYNCERAKQDADVMITLIGQKILLIPQNATFVRFNAHAVKSGTGKSRNNPIVPQCPECWEYYMELKRKMGRGG